MLDVLSMHSAITLSLYSKVKSSCIMSMALEAMYTNGERGIRKQLKRNIPKFIDVATIFGTDDSDELINKFYDQRSDYIHGLKNLPNPFRPGSFPNNQVHEHDSGLWTAKAHALVLLIESLRKLALQGDKEITFK